MDNQKIIDSIFSGVEQVKLRNENTADEKKLFSQFVPLIDFNSLKTPNTQIVYGRNGTGKTHLIRAFHFNTLEEFEINKIFPIYIDAQHLQLNYSSEFTANELVLKYYNGFVTSILVSLKSFFQSKNTIKRLEKVFGGKTKGKLDSINKSISKIEEYLNEKKIDEKLKEYVKKVEVDDKGSSKLWAKAEASATVKPESVTSGFSLGAGASGEIEHINKTAVEIVFKGLSFIDYIEVRNEIESIIDLCEIESIIILVDEWSSINISLQPMFAEMIKRTLTSSPKIFLKIFALRYFTNLSAIHNPPHRIGFQNGIDISPLADLDDFLTFDSNPNNVSFFLTAVLFFHLKEFMEEEIEISDFREILEYHLFDSDETYFELLRASEGNPRDFLVLFSHCAKPINLDKNDRISRKKVIRIASKYFVDNKAREIENNKIANDLFGKLFKKVVSNKEKTFLISKELIDERIKELWHYRFIHLINPSYSHVNEDGDVSEFLLYSIDYGKLLSLNISERGDKLINSISKKYNKLVKLGLIMPEIDMGIRLLVDSKIVKEDKIKKWAGLMLSNNQEPIPTTLKTTDEFVEKILMDDLLQ